MRLSIVFFSLFIGFSLQAQDTCAADVGLDIGKSAPSFELHDLSGKTIRLSDFKGNVILLNFWSTLCAPCTAEMPSLNRLHAALLNQGVVVIAVSIDASDRPVREFIKDKNITFPVLRDGEKEVFFDLYAGPSLPATFILDRKGIITEKVSGQKDWDDHEILKKISNLAKKR